MLANEVLVVLILLALVGAAWWTASRIRESAQAVVARTCEHQEVQLLDATVALRRLRLVRLSALQLAIERTYSFDYTADGVRRESGVVIFRGDRPVSVVMGSGPARQAP